MVMHEIKNFQIIKTGVAFTRKLREMFKFIKPSLYIKYILSMTLISYIQLRVHHNQQWVGYVEKCRL